MTADVKRRSMAWQQPGPVGDSAPAPATMPQIKTRVHRRILERLNLSTLDKLGRDEVVATIAKVVQDLVAQEQLPLNLGERELLVRQVVDEIFGLGPVEPLMQDPDVADILVNTYDQVYIERHGKLIRTDVHWTLSNDYEAVSHSINSATPVAQNPRSRYTRDLQALGVDLLGLRPKANGARRLSGSKLIGDLIGRFRGRAEEGAS